MGATGQPATVSEPLTSPGPGTGACATTGTSATGTSATQRDPLSGDGLGQLHEVSVRVAQVGAHDRPPRARAPNRPRLNRHTEIPEPRDSVRQRDVEEEAQVGAAWRGP